MINKSCKNQHTSARHVRELVGNGVSAANIARLLAALGLSGGGNWG
jgi:hypothetical protein